MMYRALANISLPVALAAGLWFSSQAQTASPASVPQAPVQASPTKRPAPAPNPLGVHGLVNSNEAANLYGAPVVQIVARVNDRVITNDDITRAQTQLDQDAHQNNWSLEQYNHSEKNLLRDLIDQQLLLSKGKQLGITGDTELIKRLDEIRKQNHLDSLDDLEKAVEQQGISFEDFKANIRNGIVTQEVVRSKVGSRIQISQAEIEKYYKEHAADFTQPESVHLNEILIPTSDNPTPKQLADASAKANEVEAKLKAGGKFGDLAKKYSSGPTAQEGGDLGKFKRGALAKVIEDQTFSLPTGGHTAPIRTKQGYIILQVTDHTPGGVEPLQKAMPEIEQGIYMQKIQPAVRSYLVRLREEAYIDIRPGYTDTAASPNETKPTYTAYAPPQPKKKKKKKRFDRREVRYSNARGRKKRAPALTAVAQKSPNGTGTAAAAPSSAAAAPPTTLASSRKPRLFKKQRARKPKREKLRYGRPPEEKVSDQQVASAAPNPGSAAPDAIGGTEAQPLGPDLEHAPVINPPAKTKTRFSDQARNKSRVVKIKTKRHKGKKKAKKVAKLKNDNAQSTPLSQTEVANQTVQDAPLGLQGAPTGKKKKKKVKVKGEEKTRLADKKKTEKQPASGGSATQTNDSTDSTSSPNSSQSGPPLPQPRQPS